MERDYKVTSENEEDEGGFETAFANHVVRAFELDYEYLKKASQQKEAPPSRWHSLPPACHRGGAQACD